MPHPQGAYRIFLAPEFQPAPSAESMPMLPAPIHANEADRIESLRRTLLRSYDILGRFDPTEFIAILPDADAVLARELAERIQLGMEAPFLVGE